MFGTLIRVTSYHQYLAWQLIKTWMFVFLDKKFTRLTNYQPIDPNFLGHPDMGPLDLEDHPTKTFCGL